MSAGGSPERLTTLLLEHADRINGGPGGGHWGWMDLRPIPKKNANKFLLQSMIDYRWKTETAHRKASEFAEIELGDPEELWETIVRIPESTWAGRSGDRKLHCTSNRHLKIRVMAGTLVSEYDGDATQLWADRLPLQTLARLNDLGLGPQLSRMTVGALIDEEQIDGTGDVKPDIHLRRVLGRALEGRVFSEDEVLIVTRAMRPADCWSLDWPSWHMGRNWCRATIPLCEGCPLQSECRFRSERCDRPYLAPGV